MLEIGPGTGYYSTRIAACLEPGGMLDILDVRQRFLDHTTKRARAEGLANVTPTLGEGGSLPYPDGCFDAAYLVTVLGEIPDPQAALIELRRVLKPTGRLVVGEIFIDPDFPTFRWLVEHARAAGLVLERRLGMPFAYFARFSPAASLPGDRSRNGRHQDHDGYLLWPPREPPPMPPIIIHTINPIISMHGSAKTR
jgi:SAM-dependent methyltransferase